MRLARFWLVALVGVSLLASVQAAHAQIVHQLATWDTPPDGTVHVGDDFDPDLDAMLTCSGCWHGREGEPAAGSLITYGHSTAQATQGTGSLEAFITGRGAGGTYNPEINGSTEITLDTHFDYPLQATYSSTTNPAAGGPDPRFNTIIDALLGTQELYTVEFDIIYDVEQMRSIEWQPPEETVDPEGNGQYPQRFFWVGMQGNINNSLSQNFSFVGFDANTINPFDEQWDDDPFPVFNASFPLTAFGWELDPENLPTFVQFGFLYNSVFGTLPAPNNTEQAHLYFDNFRLVEVDVISQVDLNDNGMADLGDFDLFMGGHYADMMDPGITPGPNGRRDDFDDDGDNDFDDYQSFENLYDAAVGMAGGLQLALEGRAVPEPGALCLASLGAVALLARRARRMAPLVLVACLAAVAARPAQAQMGMAGEIQLLESFEMVTDGMFDNWVAPDFAAAGTNPTVTPSTSFGVTDGTYSLVVTQAEGVLDNNGNPVFSWNANTSVNFAAGSAAYDALTEAVNIGAEHYQVLVDAAFDELEMGEAFDLQVFLGLDFVGQLIEPAMDKGTTWIIDDGTVQFTDVAIPLSAFDLADVEDLGNPEISMQIGFSSENDLGLDPFSAYLDNVRLEQLTEPDLLTLTIDRSDGSAVLSNDSGVDLTWNYLQILSGESDEQGSLDPVGWNSLADQDIGGEGTWVEGGGSSETILVEGSLLESYTLANGGSIPLGNLYSGRSEADEDLRFQIRKIGEISEGVPYPPFRTYDQIVEYINDYPPGVNGDFNNDGVVNALDYAVWRDNLGQDVTLPNDGGLGTPVGAAHYDLWQENFGATSVPGAAAAPEPAALSLVLACSVGFIGAGRSLGQRIV